MAEPQDARLAATLRRAIDAGLLPPDAQPQVPPSRPWPVVLLTALGAWLAAFPLLGVVSLLLGPLMLAAGGPYFVGVLVLAGAVVVLRARAVPLFLEQLAIPALLVGMGTLGFGAFRDLSHSTAALWLAAVALVVALMVPRAWLRTLLGAAMAALVALALLRLSGSWNDVFAPGRLWTVWHGVGLLWLLALVVQHTLLADGVLARWAAALESIAAGWLLLTLAALALAAGMSFLVGGMLGGGLGELSRELSTQPGVAAWREGRPAVSALLAAAAAGWAALRWPGVRRPPLAVAALVLIGLAWLQPVLGALLAALALTATTRRWAQASAAAAAAAWALGAYYYALALPLATKAALLTVAGGVLGALAWWMLRPGDAPAPLAAAGSAEPTGAAPEARPAPLPPRALALLTALGALAPLLVAAVGIWQKEDLIAHGRPVLVELAPVDPRSLMQGDFMRLDFRLPPEVDANGGPAPGARRPHVVARRDADNVATLQRLARPGETLGPDEFLFELTPRNGRWWLVSDAWFFAEGDAQRWARARYGEFRVAPDGRALLVGMADAKRRRIEPAGAADSGP